MMSETIVDLEYLKISDYLKENAGNMNFVIDYEKTMAKHLLLSACSFLEYWFQNIIKKHTQLIIANDYLINNLIFDSAISKSFYTYFNFPDKKVHIFKKFKHQDYNLVLYKCVEKESYKVFKDGFCNLFNMRNKLVHENYAAQSLDKTLAEVYFLFGHARCFLFTLDKFIHEVQKEKQNTI